MSGSVLGSGHTLVEKENMVPTFAELRFYNGLTEDA